MTRTDTQATIEAARSALFAREAAGQVVAEAEWDAVAARQRAFDTQAGLWEDSGYVRFLL